MCKKASLRNCFAVASLRQKTSTDKGKASPCRLVAKPLSSKAERLACPVFCCPSHSHRRCSFQRSGVALPRGCARDLLRKPRLPASRAAFRTLSATSLRGRAQKQVASDSRSALKHCYAAFREPRHSTTCVPR
jgi:hypothetical protein